MSISFPTPRTAQLTRDGKPCECMCHNSLYPCATFSGSPCCYYPSRAAELKDRGILEKQEMSGRELGGYLDEFRSTLPWWVTPLRSILERIVRNQIRVTIKSKGL